MDTDKIRALCRALETGSLSAAAEELGYTPSGISRAVAALEEECGLTLLRRGRHGVQPTEACERLMPHFHRILTAQKDLQQEADAIAGVETGRLSIGSSYGNYYGFLAKLIGGFGRSHPGIEIELFEGTSTELSEAIAEGRADLCVISRRENELEWIPLRKDPMVAVVPESWPFGSADESYPIGRFAVDPFIEIHPGRETDNSRVFENASIRPNRRYGCADSMAALSMVEAGLGATMINGILLENWHGNARIMPIDPPQMIEIGILMTSPETASPAAKSFVLYAKTRMESKDDIMGLTKCGIPDLP